MPHNVAHLQYRITYKCKGCATSRPYYGHLFDDWDNAKRVADQLKEQGLIVSIESRQIGPWAKEPFVR